MTKGLKMGSPKRPAVLAIASVLALVMANTAQAMDFSPGNWMNPSKWFGGNKDRDYYDDRWGGPGYGYGAPGYGYGGPGYGYGVPGYGYGGPGYGYGAPGYGYGGYQGAPGQAGAGAPPPR